MGPAFIEIGRKQHKKASGSRRCAIARHSSRTVIVRRIGAVHRLPLVLGKSHRPSHVDAIDQGRIIVRRLRAVHSLRHRPPLKHLLGAGFSSSSPAAPLSRLEIFWRAAPACFF